MKALFLITLFTLFNAHAKWQDEVDTASKTYLKNSNATAVSVLAGYKRFTLHHFIKGATKTDKFDLASVSKVFTATAIMKLQEQKKLNITDKVCKYFAEYCSKSKATITIEDLLRHRSGLPAWDSIGKYPDIKKSILGMKLKVKPRTQFIYSDIGFLTLGFLVEKVSKQSLDKFLNDSFFAPMKLENTAYNPEGKCVLTVNVKSECDVHDDNTKELDGVAGHAGLFSTATDIKKFINLFLTTNTFLNKTTVKEMTTKAKNSSRGLGFDITSGYSNWSRGSFFSKGKSFGHTGYTGTSIWVDHSGVYVIILTNRVMNGDTLTSKKQVLRFRKQIADIVGKAIIPHRDNSNK